MKAAWGYVRLSRTGRDASIDEQKASIRKYARRFDDLELQTTLNEGTETSGFSSDREKYNRLTGRIEDASIDAVVVRDRARLSRDFDERLRLITLFRSTGVEWHVIEAGGHIDLTDIYTAGMECVHAAMDHVKKMVEIERSREATRQRIESGAYHGTPPFGLRFAEDKEHLEKHPHQFEQLKEILERRTNGDRVVDVAEDIGVSTATVSRVANRGIEWYQDKLAEYGLEDTNLPASHQG